MEASRHNPGIVRDAIRTSFVMLGGEASIKELHVAVESRLNEPVSRSSVQSYVQLNSPDQFEKVSRGRYRLAQEPATAYAPTLFEPFPQIRIGAATLVHADCFAWLKQRGENSIHAVVTDPPYGLVEYSKSEQKKLKAGRGGVWRIPPSFDGHQRAPLPRFTTLTEAQLDGLHAFFLRWGAAVLRVLVPGGHVMVASNPLVSYLVSDALAKAGLERRGELIRLVMTMRGGDRPKNAHEEFDGVSVMPRSQWEPWLLYRKPVEGRVQDNLHRWKTGGLRRISDEQPFGDVITSHPTRRKEKQIAPHPSLKPQAFMRQVVRAALPLGEGIVLDPFAGGGSTLAAANAVGYESIGLERDAEYVKLAQRAIPDLAALAV
jgi:site-specific DNA-methyltransferase (adenine-specific)